MMKDNKQRMYRALAQPALPFSLPYDSMQSMDEVDELTGRDFERCVSVLMEEAGGELLRDQGRAGDHGADIVANMASPLDLTVIQCKHFDAGAEKAVPAAWVRELLGTGHHFRAQTMILVTNGRFSAQANWFGAVNGVHMIGREALTKWMFGGLRVSSPLHYVLRETARDCVIRAREYKPEEKTVTARSALQERLEKLLRGDMA